MEQEKKETVFADGMMFYKPRENAPDFIRGSISFKAEEAIAFLKKYKDTNGWVNVDLKKSKAGKLYLALNTYNRKFGPQPDPARNDQQFSQATPAPATEYPAEDINPDDIPF